jgi:hypothetical protein
MAETPVSKEMLELYVAVLEKQVSQATLIVKTLEELNDKIKEINAHFTNGFRSELMEHTTKEITELAHKLEKTLTIASIVEDNVKKGVDTEKNLSHQAYELATEMKDKISALKGDVAELKASMKVERAISITGWSTFILALITLILRAAGKL